MALLFYIVDLPTLIFLFDPPFSSLSFNFILFIIFRFRKTSLIRNYVNFVSCNCVTIYDKTRLVVLCEIQDWIISLP